MDDKRNASTFANRTRQQPQTRQRLVGLRLLVRFDPPHAHCGLDLRKT